MENWVSQKALDRDKLSDLIDRLFPDDLEVQTDRFDELFQEQKQEEDSKQFVNFQIGHEYYAVRIQNVREIIKLPHVSFLPSSGPNIKGLMNLRGNILPVISTHKLFQVEPLENTSGEKLIIVMEIRNSQLGFIVDSVSQVLELRKEDIDPPMVTLEMEKTDYVLGEATINGQLVGILNIEKLVQNEIFVKKDFSTDASKLRTAHGQKLH